MKTQGAVLGFLGVGMGLVLAGFAGAAESSPRGLSGEQRLAVRESMARGSAYLRSRQLADGSWLQHPAVTSLAAASLLAVEGAEAEASRASALRGLDYVVSFAQPDGSIWSAAEGEYPNYSTAVSLIALAAADRPQDRHVMAKARMYLLGPTSQFAGLPSSDPSYGGIGYGKLKRPDLSNTQWALEAVYVTEHLDREPYTDDPAAPERSRLLWERATTFLTRCQNLAETNASGWVASDPENRGGFIYFPGSTEQDLTAESKAGEVDLEGVRALRSYGSMTYAGLKSMIYARLRRDDPRVEAAVEWIGRHYTFEENPGLGAQGLFYYLHTCAKALQALGEETITDAAGMPRAWRGDLAARLLDLQQADGSWVNEGSGRWMENIPELATCYAMLSLRVVSAPPGPTVGTQP